MEKSLMSKNMCSAGSNVKTGEYSPDEESSWTFYFEEFLRDNDYHEYDQEISNCYDQDTNYNTNTTNSDNNNNNNMVSHAMSKKVGDNGFCWDNNNYKKLSFKKRKSTKGAIVDDALEDTASSPVNSPKVGYFSHPEMNRKEKEIMDISEEKGGFGIAGGDNNIGDCTELKKRGLCLVPVSNLANYFA